MTGQATRLKIIRQRLGESTGDMVYQTEDGRWWKRWNGIDKTGQSLGEKTNGSIRLID